MTRDFVQWGAALIFAAALGSAPAARAQYGSPPGYGGWTSGGELPGPTVFDLSAMAGFKTNGDIGTNGGSIEIGDGPTFGAILDYRVNRYGSVELAWMYDSPDARFISINSLYPSTKTFAVHTHYFQFGGITSKPMGRTEPYVGLTLGGVYLVPDQIEYTTGGTLNAHDTWHFASTVSLGTKIWLSKSVGIRLEGRLLMPILFNSGGFYAGSGGAGLYASGGVPSLQFAFTGGLMFGK
jgi:hypothetical protein